MKTTDSNVTRIGPSAADATDLETLPVRQNGAVLFADIAAPPMNLLGTELFAKYWCSRAGDPDYFISHVDVTPIADYREQP